MDRKKIPYGLVVALGGMVSDQGTWRAVGQSAGYSGPRDLAGFFGGRIPSMVLNGDGSRTLTPAG